MDLAKIRSQIAHTKHAEEHQFIQDLISSPVLTDAQRSKIVESAKDIVKTCRKDVRSQTLLDSFLQEFGLSNKEGVALMCLAEALLRVPDTTTADRLIAEKIMSGDWKSHNGNSDSLFVNGATWGMILTGKMVQLDPEITNEPGNWMRSLSSKLSEPVVRRAVLQAMRFMGSQYVLGRSINEGIKNGRKQNPESIRYSFDMLGEAARTYEDAERYFQSYRDAIIAIGKGNKKDDVYTANGISVKLSALHPQYHFSHYATVMHELLPKITELCVVAKQYNLGLSIDAEEAARLDMSFDIFEALSRDPVLSDWNGLGFVLQAYQKRAPQVAHWLVQLASETNKKLNVRLVKGAYWDAEIKHAQEQGLPDYPVFTRKINTDACYLHCADILLKAKDSIYPQFATHNAYTTVAIIELAKGLNNTNFEFQRLHGMGELLYKHLLKTYSDLDLNLRIYAPIGQHEDLLPYLVRRLLENGANSSFVNRFLDDEAPIDELISDTYSEVSRHQKYRHTKIPLPINVFNADNEARNNALGLDLDAVDDTQEILSAMQSVANDDLHAHSIVSGKSHVADLIEIQNPSMNSQAAGHCSYASSETIELALASANSEHEIWKNTPVAERAEILFRTADLLEKNMPELIGIITREAGRTIADGVSEVREAVDFCRYYALQAIKTQSGNDALPSRGVFFCISPWNFPLAIFAGQIAAALATGNCVIAKPAEQTPLIAASAVQLFHEAGCPTKALHLILGEGAKVGAQVISDERIDGVVFTGSTITAQFINQQIAKRPGSTIPFIAETGGQNCMIIDSSALPEQVVDDVISSAFHSAGQRCSALRVLYVQDVIADKVIKMLNGAMQTLSIGNPNRLTTDIGPVIDTKARNILLKHVDYIKPLSKLHLSVPMNIELPQLGSYFQPQAFEIDSIKRLSVEVFGPVLHIIRYKIDDLDKVIAEVNSTGFGLTLGVHSRIEAFANYVFRKTSAGNTYINRNIIGAVVGVNPFGGKGLSGTGPKAGGPSYLYRFQKHETNNYVNEVNTHSENPEAISSTEFTLSSIGHSLKAFTKWSKFLVEERAEIINKALSQVEQGNDISLDSIIKNIVNTLANPLSLPGPTGAQNDLFSEARGPIGLVISDQDERSDIIKIMTLILTSGNTLILQFISDDVKNKFKEFITSADSSLPDNLIESFTSTNHNALAVNEEIVAIAISVSNKLKSALRQSLAQRKGAIAPLIEFGNKIEETQRTLAYLTYFVSERTKTDNLVARGGNTQLFNLQE